MGDVDLIEKDEWGEDPAHIQVIIRNKEPIELLDFTASLTALAREHASKLRADRPKIAAEETRLLVVDVRKGSIILTLLPVLVPIVATAEFMNTAVAFVEHMKTLVGYLSSPRGRAPDATTQQLKNMGDVFTTVAKDSQGEMMISARYKNGEVMQELTVTRDEARTITENTRQQQAEISSNESETYIRVLLRLHQSSVEGLKVGKRSSEKGIVERIDNTPRPLVYVSDLAGQRIKDEILGPEGNPFQKGFIVDLDVETVDGKPRVYRILEVYDVIDLDD